MTEAEVDPLSTIDVSLLRLRRFTQAPPPRRAPGPGESVEISTVLVIEAVEQLSAGGVVAAVGDVADRLSVAPSTASRLIERAEAVGMVERRRDAHDSRRVALVLTDGGASLAARAREFRRRRLADVLASWPAERVERFSVDLRDFAQLALDPQERDQPQLSPDLRR